MHANGTEWDAKHYSKNSHLQKSLSSQMLGNEDLENRNILDVGCGDGAITAQMKTHTNTVVGLDNSSNMIRFARENYQECSFIEQDISQSKLNDQYDFVTGFNSLHWIENIEQALLNIYQSMTDGGKLIGLIYPRCEDLWKASENLAKSNKYQSYFKSFSNPYHFHTIDSFSELLRDSGFSQINITQETRSQLYNDERRFGDYIAGWMPHAKVAPPEFMIDWVTEYKQLTSQKSSSTEMSYDVIMFQCYKAKH